ncbi:hypothetical protein D9M72_344500 [compost metagenome]
MEVLEQFKHFGLHRDVKSRRRLIRHHQLRLERQRPGNAHALLLPAGQFMRVPVAITPRQLNLVKQCLDPLLQPASLGFPG